MKDEDKFYKCVGFKCDKCNCAIEHCFCKPKEVDLDHKYNIYSHKSIDHIDHYYWTKRVALLALIVWGVWAVVL
jgi:hypothetical protein